MKIALLVAALVGCNGATGTGWRPAATSDESTVVLARTPDAVVTVADLREILAQLSRPSTPPQAREILDKAIDIELLAAEARRRGYPDRPDITWQLKNVLASAVTKADAEKVRAKVKDEPGAELSRQAVREQVRAAKQALVADLRRGVAIDEAAVAKVLADPTLVSQTPVAAAETDTNEPAPPSP
jgi:hypothetical protein